MFRFTETIIRELSACASPKLQCWLRLHISLYEVIGIVAACLFRLQMQTEHCNFEAQAESSLMTVYVNRNMLEQLL